MTVAIDPDLVVEYVLPRDRGSKQPTKFHLKPLSGPDARIAIAGAVGTADDKADAYYDALRISLVGWSNMQRKDADVPFETVNELVRGKRRMVPTEATMKCIGPEDIMLLANAASDYAHLTSDEVKN